MGITIISLDRWTSDDRADIFATLRQGRVIAYPTDTIYGLGIDVFNTGAVETLLRMKGRSSQKPVSILYAGVERLLQNFNHLNNFQRYAVNALLPGKVTLLLPVKSDEQFPSPFSRDGYVGARVINLPELNTLLMDYPNPISTTSINPTDETPARSVAEIQRYFPEEISYIIDNGSVKRALSSTIIKLNMNSWNIIREGAVPADRIDKILNHLK